MLLNYLRKEKLSLLVFEEKVYALRLLFLLPTIDCLVKYFSPFTIILDSIYHYINDEICGCREFIFKVCYLSIWDKNLEKKNIVFYYFMIVKLSVFPLNFPFSLEGFTTINNFWCHFTATSFILIFYCSWWLLWIHILITWWKGNLFVLAYRIFPYSGIRAQVEMCGLEWRI